MYVHQAPITTTQYVSALSGAPSVGPLSPGVYSNPIPSVPGYGSHSYVLSHPISIGEDGSFHRQEPVVVDKVGGSFRRQEPALVDNVERPHVRVLQESVDPDAYIHKSGEKGMEVKVVDCHGDQWEPDYLPEGAGVVGGYVAPYHASRDLNRVVEKRTESLQLHLYDPYSQPRNRPMGYCPAMPGKDYGEKIKAIVWNPNMKHEHEGTVPLSHGHPSFFERTGQLRKDQIPPPRDMTYVEHTPLPLRALAPQRLNTVLSRRDED
uniref:Uncharacterized protein n=1 Tax=Eutreptiella gymnastica TaxID=73025 RepID=A0A6U7X5A5_9EUGL